MGLSGAFIDGGAGRILVVNHRPEAIAEHAVLVIPAFAEEMNKSRRLVWETGVALRERGLWTLVPDLFGTGDSEGDFADARWDIWVDDVCRTVQWARANGAVKISVLAVRFGMALFAAATERMNETFDRAVAWQPVVSGADVLRPLVRMKVMSQRMAGGPAVSADAMLRELLDGDQPLELGGYLLSPALAKSISAVRSVEPAGAPAGVAFEFEPATGARQEAATGGAASGAGGWRVERIVAERFWTAVEPRANPRLAAATADFLSATS